MRKLAKVFALILGISLFLPSFAKANTNLFKNTVLGIEALSEPEKVENGKSYKLKFKLTNITDFDLKGEFSLREIGPDKLNKYFKLKDKALSENEFEIKAKEVKNLEYELLADPSLSSNKYPVTLSIKIADREFVDRVYIEVENPHGQVAPYDGEGSDILTSLAVLEKGQDPNKAMADDKCPDANKDTKKEPVKEEPKADDKNQGQKEEPKAKDSKPAPSMPTMDFPPVSDPGPIAMTSGFGGGDIGGEGVKLSGEVVKNKPKLIVDKYSFSPETPYAGEEFAMDLSFYNTNADKSVRNIKIFLTSSDSAMPANPKDMGVGAASSSSVFTPVDSSNTFFISYIEPGGTVRKTINLTTSPTIAAKNYQVVANFEYEDKDGNEYTAQEMIGIPIVQKSKLDTSEITLPSEVFMDEPIDGNIEFYNTGKDTLYNLMVKLEGDFTSDTKQYYVGNFQSGSSDSFSLDLMAKNPGDNKGKVVFTYEDASGKQNKLEKEFSVLVNEGMNPEMEQMGGEGPMEGQMPEDANKGQINPLFIGAGALALAGGGFLVYKKRKNKKAQEELKIDED